MRWKRGYPEPESTILTLVLVAVYLNWEHKCAPSWGDIHCNFWNNTEDTSSVPCCLLDSSVWVLLSSGQFPSTFVEEVTIPSTKPGDRLYVCINDFSSAQAGNLSLKRGTGIPRTDKRVFQAVTEVWVTVFMTSSHKAAGVLSERTQTLFCVDVS